MVEVTDADREAAASVAVLAEMRELILSGRADHHAEPWARRRMAAYQAAIADVVEWLREAFTTPTAEHYANRITRRFGKDA